MRKRCNRQKRSAVPPTLVALAMSPDIGLMNHLAVEAIAGGYGDPKHFNILLDARDLLRIAGGHKRDEECLGVSDFAGEALASIRERHGKTGKIGATGEELKALKLLCEYHDDWFNRQSGELFVAAVQALERLRSAG